MDRDGSLLIPPRQDLESNGWSLSKISGSGSGSNYPLREFLHFNIRLMTPFQVYLKHMFLHIVFLYRPGRGKYGVNHFHCML